MMEDDFHERLTRIPAPGDTDADVESIPERIGRYRLLEKLGEGGMGEVFLAEQSEPVRRKLALKVIKLGMDTKQVVARFEAERQALAVMDHPSIAHVYDAGATESGRPYFVMELVRGVPISLYCDQHGLSLRERLELFLPVCHAIQHAHQKGVIHRDLKPSNILVGEHEGGPLPMVIDFGVAKATGQQLTENTLYTAHGQMIGTPEYASPEQAHYSGIDIDTRTDVYSLGVVLYELLTGDLPFGRGALAEFGILELQRKIREDDPPKPSTRLSGRRSRGEGASPQVARDRGSWVRAVRGDLDWIVMKALEKERARRYDTATALATDIQRFLDLEPVSARPPKASYRALKFLRRNRLGVGLAAVTLVVLLAGVVGTTVGFFRAQHEARKAITVTEFITDMLSKVDPETALGDDVTVRQVLDEAAGKVGVDFAGEPELEAELRATIGTMYSRLGHHEEGLSHLERSVELYGQTLGSEHRKTIEALNHLGRNYLDLGRYEDAAALWGRLLPIWSKKWGENARDTLTMMQNLAAAYLGAKQYERAEPLLVTVLEKRRRVLGDEAPPTTSTMNNLGHLYLDTGRYDEAEPLFRETLEIRRRTGHPRTAISVYNLGDLYFTTGRYDLAEPLMREALAGFESIYGEDHPNTLLPLSRLSTILVEQGRFDEAEPIALDNYRRHEARYGADDASTVSAVEALVELFEKSDRPALATKWRKRLPRP